jgi:SPP1 family predicted phage head-tail adaptor
MLKAGDMDQKAEIQTPAEGVNSIGEPTFTYSAFATRWVALLPLSGAERVASLQNEGTVTHRVRLRYTPGLKPKMRMVSEGRTFEIDSVVERGRREEHELLVTEVVD